VEEKKGESLSNKDLFVETEALLKKLELLNFDTEKVLSIASKDALRAQVMSRKKATLLQIMSSQMTWRSSWMNHLGQKERRRGWRPRTLE
jgi:hypothetical protein